jgi:hypothetical protein
MGLTVWAALRGMEVWVPGSGLTAAVVRLSVTILAGLFTVALSARLLRIAEFNAVLDQIRSRFMARVR